MTEIDTLTQTNGFSNLNPLGNGRVRVSGFMIHEGTYNDITFTKEALDQCVNSFVGKVMLVDHTNSVRNVVGEIMSVEARVDPSNGLYGLAYEADIDESEEQLLHKMELGFIKSTSIGIISEKKCSLCGADIFECNHWFWDEGFQILATNIEGKELSIVAVPADKDASVGLAFSDDNFLEELETLKTNRRTTMSDKFEEKYAQLMDEFSEFKSDKADELKALKDDFAAQKEELEAQKESLEIEMASKVEEALNLKNEITELNAEKESLAAKVSEYEEVFASMEEEKLSALREEVTQLNAELGAGLSEERIAQLSEASLNEFKESFANIKENTVTEVQPNPNGEQHYQEKEVDTDAAPIDQFMSRIGL